MHVRRFPSLGLHHTLQRTAGVGRMVVLD
jgi:hypothetical protein